MLLALLLPHRVVAQTTTSLLPDATVLESRMFGFRLLSSWTRYDELLGNGGARNLAASFNTDSLGPTQLPVLGGTQAAIRTASGLSNFQVNAGQIVSAANSRVVTAPLIVQYGLTSKLTLGVVVPFVQTRTTLSARLNPDTLHANVGPNPEQLNSGLLAQSAALVLSIRGAASTLQQQLTGCQANPSGSGCSTLLAQQSAAQSLIQTSGVFSNAIQELYGTDASHTGQAFVPLATGATQTAINAQIQSLSTQFQNFLGSGNVITGAVTGAPGPAAYGQLQSLLTSFGHDTLQSTDRTSIGDISVGATYQLANTFGDTSAEAAGRTHFRAAINVTYRIGTGQPANRNRLFDIGTGYGQAGVEAGFATDVQIGRTLTTSAIASYTTQLGSVATARVPNAGNAIFPLGSTFGTGIGAGNTYSAGNVLALSLVPRWRLAGYFSLNGLYSMVRTGADRYTVAPVVPPVIDPIPGVIAPIFVTPVAPFGVAASTAQQVGIGFSYSTIVSPRRGPGALPFEASFSHLETISGSGGPVPKTFRDQIELRVYWP